MGDEAISVVKSTSYVQVSDEVLMDAGLIPDTRPPLPWRTRLRYRWKAAVHRARTRLGEIVAGRRFDDD